MTPNVDPIKYVEDKHHNPNNKAKGIPYKEGKAKIKRFANENWGKGSEQQLNIMNSIRNQVEVADGVGAADAIVDEVVREVPTGRGRGWNDSSKSRPAGWTVGICLKECVHQGTATCDSCFQFSKLEPKE